MAHFGPAPDDEADFFSGEHCILKLPSNRVVSCGTFSEPTLQELRDAVAKVLEKSGVKEEIFRAASLRGGRSIPEEASPSSGKERPQATSSPLIHLEHITDDARSMHSKPENLFATIQAASQFNYLEFPSPNGKPENGVTVYERDRTQGPACAIACAGGTVYRNYLVKRTDIPGGENGTRGQSRDSQFNGLRDVEAALPRKFWIVRNGYINSSPPVLQAFESWLQEDPNRAELLKAKVRIGIQANVQVTNEEVFGMSPTIAKGLHGSESYGVQTVTQTYNSAISVAYSICSDEHWAPLAKLVLDASYEATLLVGILNVARIATRYKKLPPVLLTKVGGGVFGNSAEWIQRAIIGACQQVAKFGVPLDVRLVHYGAIESGYERMPTSFGQKS